MRTMIISMALGAALVATGSAQAATCWDKTSYEAAQLRDFDTMLMVATLRCRINSVDFSDDYNRFVRDKRPILAQANIDIRAQFARTVGEAQSLGAYDDFMTKVANGYGGGSEHMTCADYAAMAKSAADASSVRSDLVDLAAQSGAQPLVPGNRCGIIVAMNEK